LSLFKIIKNNSLESFGDVLKGPQIIIDTLDVLSGNMES